MQIKQDPITSLWARSDGAVLLPPSGTKFKKFHWSFGYDKGDGYRVVRYKGKWHLTHRIICRAFHGLPPADKPCVDHINRLKADNRPCNLRYTSYKGNNDNKDCVDKSIEKYGVRWCENKKAYMKAHDKAYNAAKLARMRAQGLTYRKGPDGKAGWHPRIRT